MGVLLMGEGPFVPLLLQAWSTAWQHVHDIALTNCNFDLATLTVCMLLAVKCIDDLYTNVL